MRIENLVESLKKADEGDLSLEAEDLLRTSSLNQLRTTAGIQEFDKVDNQEIILKAGRR